MVDRVPVAGIITKILLEPYQEIATPDNNKTYIPTNIQFV